MASREQSIDNFEALFGDDVNLGEVLRGERATKGVTLRDVEHQIKIKANYLEAVEDADLSRLPESDFVAGYVRSYARFLGLDPNIILNRFLLETGMRAPKDTFGVKAVASKDKTKSVSKAKVVHFSPVNSVQTSPLGFVSKTLGAFAALLPMLLVLLVVGGLGYGGYRMFLDVQSVEISPIEVQPLITTGTNSGYQTVETEEATIPSIDYSRLYERQALDRPVLTPRESRLADVDPSTTGLLVETNPVTPSSPSQNGTIQTAAEVDEPIVSVVNEAPALEIVAKGEAWVRVTTEDGSTLYEKLMSAGETYEVSLEDGAPLLRAGNATELYVRLNGELYGPVGENIGHVVNKMVLDPASLQDELTAQPELEIETLPVEDEKLASL